MQNYCIQRAFFRYEVDFKSLVDELWNTDISTDKKQDTYIKVGYFGD